jgi:tetratricopeptide (TPR) repeat protein
MKSEIARKQRRLHWLGLACVMALVGVLSAPAAQNELQPGTSAADTNSVDLLRSNLQLQEQLHRVQLSIEESREQSDAAAVKNAQSIANRLQNLEQTLAMERKRDIDAVHSSTRVMWIVASTFGIVGILAMVLMAYQWRTVSRLAQVGLPLYGPGGSALTPFGSESEERRLLGNGSVERSNTQLISALELLEKRIKDLEITSSGAGRTVASPNHDSPALPAGGTVVEAIAQTTNGASRSRINVLLGKGESLLKLDDTERALTCIDEVLSIEPRHPDALLQKAVALERLRKFTEAIDCYDQAIAADGALTIAYIQKGGLLNRMEKYDEALACYEQALRAQART